MKESGEAPRHSLETVFASLLSQAKNTQPYCGPRLSMSQI